MTNTTDRELLELAAKAAGWTVVRWTDDDTALLLEGIQQPFNALQENPHSDCMGDALRLAVKLRLVIDTDYNDGAAVGSAYLSMDCFHEYDPPLRFGADRNAATRRAIVQAAAAIAKAEDAV